MESSELYGNVWPRLRRAIPNTPASYMNFHGLVPLVNMSIQPARLGISSPSDRGATLLELRRNKRVLRRMSTHTIVELVRHVF